MKLYACKGGLVYAAQLTEESLPMLCERLSAKGRSTPVEMMVGGECAKEGDYIVVQDDNWEASVCDADYFAMQYVRVCELPSPDMYKDIRMSYSDAIKLARVALGAKGYSDEAVEQLMQVRAHVPFEAFWIIADRLLDLVPPTTGYYPGNLARRFLTADGGRVVVSREVTK
jgi:hypothetical protein